jgi:hypothetical protein
MASLCYAYEPTFLNRDEVLSDKFTKHNWFAPTGGLLVRIWNHAYRIENGTAIVREDCLLGDISRNTVKIFHIMGSGFYWTITKQGDLRFINFRHIEGSLGANYNYGYSNVRPVCAF